MTFSTITEGEFPLLGPLLMLVVDTVMYFLLAVYLDNVIPGKSDTSHLKRCYNSAGL